MRTAKKDCVPITQPTHRNGRPVVFRIPWGVRKYIVKRDGFKCVYCSESLNWETHTIDHIVPASAGGTEHPSNLVMCCKDCNRRASNMQFMSFEEKKSYLFQLALEAKKNKAEKLRKAAAKK